MPQTSTTATTLEPVPGSSLYRPKNPGPGEKMLFLLWTAFSPAVDLTLDEIWADSGFPVKPGYLLFFDRLVTNAQVPALETALRALLPAPLTTAVAWINFVPSSGAVSVSTLLKTGLNAESRPCVIEAVTLAVYSGIKGVYFPLETVLQGTYTDSFLNGLTCTPPTPTPVSPGLILPLAGPDNGLIGCLRFTALSSALKQPTVGKTTPVTLIDVALDPLNPLDQKRNFQIFTGRNYLVAGSPGSYRLEPAPDNP